MAAIRRRAGNVELPSRPIALFNEMRIGIFCTNNYPYPLPEGIIYANQMVAGVLADTLAEMGEEIILFAPEGSKTRARLETFGMKPYSDPAINSRYPDSYFYEHLMVSKIFCYARKYHLDLVHAHLRPFSVVPYAAVSGVTTLITVHDPLSYPAYKALPLANEFKNIYYAALSEAHRKVRLNLPWAGVVYNGVDLRQWRFSGAKGTYLCFVGRLMPQKGADIAVWSALEAGLPLKIAGTIYDEDQKYFSEKIKPYLGSQIEYLGALGQRDIEKLYQGARALLMPIRWEEPFGLVMVEAMACGAPVIAFSRGAVPEIILDGETGFVVDNQKSMVRAIEKVGKINRRRCRRQVEENFSAAGMAAGYLELYRRIENGV